MMRGRVLAVWHPLRRHKVPRGLLEALRGEGLDVREVETLADRVQSVRRIARALREAHEPGVPLDVLVLTGDSSLDHHVLTGAYRAFRPELTPERPGEITVRAPDAPGPEADWLRDWLEAPLDTSAFDPTEAWVRHHWSLRAEVTARLARARSVEQLAQGLSASAEELRLAAYGACWPGAVTIRPHGFDLSGLGASDAPGLDRYLRAIVAYPAGTAADNALYAGIPGWGFAQGQRLARLVPGLRAAWERALVRRFVRAYRDGVVVPARHSVVALDGDWQWLSSHAAGGPASGRFFAPDLRAHTGGMWGYLVRIPSVVFGEGVLGSTFVRTRAHDRDGAVRLATEGRFVEALYSNRAFIAGVGSVPSTNPSSRAGASTLVLGPPLLYCDRQRRLRFVTSGLLTFFESIAKGLLARVLHGVGLGVGRLAGGGRFVMAQPGHQTTLAEGESVAVSFHDRDGRPRFVPAQVSGEPCQVRSMTIRVAWGALPLLAAPGSLLLDAARRAGVVGGARPAVQGAHDASHPDDPDDRHVAARLQQLD